MVAGIKGICFLSSDLVAVTSSTKGEVFVISLGDKSVRRSVRLVENVKAESLCSACNGGENGMSNGKLLVADANGSLCQVDLETTPATSSCVATTPDDLRVTSVASYDDKTAFVAGAERDNKTRCFVRRVDLTQGVVLSDISMLEAPMVRALCVDRGSLFAGAIEVASEEGDEAETTIVKWSHQDDFSTQSTVGVVDGFVHVICRHPHHDNVFILLVRHDDTSFDCPIKIVRFEETSQSLTEHHAKCSIISTLPIGNDGLIRTITKHVFSAAFGVRAGREHAMAVSPDGRCVVTGSVDASTKGVVQVWNTELIFDSSKSTKFCSPC